MEDGLLSDLALWYWRWRWSHHMAWLTACAVRAQERSFRQPGYGDACGCSPRRPGPHLCKMLSDLKRIEADMRHLIYFD